MKITQWEIHINPETGRREVVDVVRDIEDPPQVADAKAPEDMLPNETETETEQP